MNVLLTIGGRLTYGPLDVILAPQFSYAENRDFQTIAPRDTARSQFASPWHIRDQSADLPLRFGDRPLAVVRPGQSSMTLRGGGLRIGAAVENEWWGPGIHNAIVMSGNAEGIPRLFFGTDERWISPIGSFEARWIVGALSESLFFDLDADNDLRSISGAVGTYQPRWQPDLTLGVARTVYAPVSSRGAIAGRALDVFTWWKNQVELPDSTIQNQSALEAALSALPPPHDREQLTSVFGRWIFPADGVEVFFEWARVVLPTSFTEIVTEPHHTQGYTLGLQWARALRSSHIFRVQTEFTYLEESATFNNRPVSSFYVSRAIPQGYTNRGRTIGAAIGPGGSSQWLSSDYIAPTWRGGVFAGRIRWDNDVYYRGRVRVEAAHDVSMFAGIRAGARVLGNAVLAEVRGTHRYNYLFQNAIAEAGGKYAVDKTNLTVRLSVSPPW